MLTIFIGMQHCFAEQGGEGQHPVKECYCNISSISEIESIEIGPAKWYNGFFSSS